MSEVFWLKKEAKALLFVDGMVKIFIHGSVPTIKIFWRGAYPSIGMNLEDWKDVILMITGPYLLNVIVFVVTFVFHLFTG